jgi:hypothetical protein
MRHDAAAKSLVSKILPTMQSKPDIVALEIASVLTGMTNRLKKVHFEIVNGSPLDAAAQAVEENPNQENIDLLADCATTNEWGCIYYPAMKSLARIAGFDWYKDGKDVQPGQREMLHEWWQKNRTNFKPAAEMK